MTDLSPEAVDEEPLHDWFIPADHGDTSSFSHLESCRTCGVIRRKDGRPDSQCKGPIRVELRDGLQ